MCQCVAMLQETKLFMLRKSLWCLMTLVHTNLDPICIPTKGVYKMRLNVLEIEVKLKDLKTTFLKPMVFKNVL